MIDAFTSKNSFINSIAFLSTWVSSVSWPRRYQYRKYLVSRYIAVYRPCLTRCYWSSWQLHPQWIANKQRIATDASKHKHNYPLVYLKKSINSAQMRFLLLPCKWLVTSVRKRGYLGRVQRWNVLVGALSVFAPTGALQNWTKIVSTGAKWLQMKIKLPSALLSRDQNCWEQHDRLLHRTRALSWVQTCPTLERSRNMSQICGALQRWTRLWCAVLGLPFPPKSSYIVYSKLEYCNSLYCNLISVGAIRPNHQEDC